MKITSLALSLLILALVVVVPSRGGVLSWLEGDLQESDGRLQADQPKTDDDDDSSEQDAVSSLVSSLHESFLELTGRRNSWYDRYNNLASKAKDNSIKIQELTTISQNVMPIIWKNWLGTNMWKMSVYEQAGLLHRLPADTSVIRQHPLYELDTDLTVNDQFTFEITMKMKKRANIGLRLMWVPEDGAPYSWDNDNILYAAHFRWVYPNRHWGKEKQVVFNTKQAGSWGDREGVFDEWPEFQIGQKFKLQITTSGINEKCFHMRLYMGHERFHLVPSKSPYDYVFCLPSSVVQQFLNDPRPLKLVLNEDIMYDLTDAFDVYEVMYMPTVLHFSNNVV